MPTRLRRTAEEKKWLGEAGAAVQRALVKLSPVAFHRFGQALKVVATDPTSDGWYVDIGSLERAEYYYGRTERTAPTFTTDLSDEVLRRVVERLSALANAVADAIELDALEGEVGDRITLGYSRLEQAKLRRKLLGRRSELSCAFCGHVVPKRLIVAAHIKRRADCTDDDIRDIAHNILPLCALGCDALFEGGYVSVRNGFLTAGPRRDGGSEVAQRVAALISDGRPTWARQRTLYFAAHRKYHTAFLRKTQAVDA